VTGDSLNLLIAAATVVASLAISYYFYRMAKKERRLVYVVTGNTVVQADKKREIEVRYKGSDVPVVTRTVITFWNAGREPIRDADIVATHPLYLKLPDGAALLDFRVVAATRPEIDFTCHLDVDLPRVLLRFSHLNYRDGAAVEVLHTGSSPATATVEGAIVGVNGAPPRIQSPLWDDPVGVVLALILTALGLGVAIFGVASREWFTLFWGVFVAVGTGLTGVSNWKKDRRRVPAHLRSTLGVAV